MSIADLRCEYTRAGLVESDLDPSPFVQFQRWFAQALEAAVPEPNAMTLATCDNAGEPNARIVLLKGVDDSGFTFFTNYESAKGRELAAHPRAALVFFWVELQRQVRVTGSVTTVPRDESAAYFHSRPRESQLGALVSRQGSPIPNREFLERRMEELTAVHAGREIPLPDYWGGYRLQPRMVEFWQGRPSRLHDRLRYARKDGGEWIIERLAP